MIHYISYVSVRILVFVLKYGIFAALWGAFSWLGTYVAKRREASNDSQRD